LRKLFEMTVDRCMAEGPVGAEGCAVDGQKKGVNRFHRSQALLRFQA